MICALSHQEEVEDEEIQCGVYLVTHQDFPVFLHCDKYFIDYQLTGQIRAGDNSVVPVEIVLVVRHTT